MDSRARFSRQPATAAKLPSGATDRVGPGHRTASARAEVMDIAMSPEALLPRSGIPIAAGLENVYISIAGLIGAGKTTLARALGETMGLPVHYEPVSDNVYLEDFYADMTRYGFPLQIYLLNKRFRQQQQIVWEGRGGVQDRTIYEDAIFAKMLRDDGLMEEREYQTYISLFNNMSNFMRKPNVIVYLDVTPEESLSRINSRSRECEAGLPLAYLQKLHVAYEAFLQDISQIIPVLRVSWHEFHSAEAMAEQIRIKYADLRTIRSIDWGIGRTAEDLAREMDALAAPSTPAPKPAKRLEQEGSPDDVFATAELA